MCKRLKADVYRKFDIYAQPITLRYKGQKKFYTNWGAATSIFLILVIFAYIGTLTHEMVNSTVYYSKQNTAPISEYPEFGPDLAPY